MISNRLLRLFTTNSTSEISLANPYESAVSPDNLLAYRPNFKDRHNSGLAGIFINIEGVFPCTIGLDDSHTLTGPSCKLFTNEEDGFNDGRAIIELGDAGNGEVEIFGSNVGIYGLAFSGCQVLTEKCLPLYFQSEIVCMLPSSICP